MAEQKITICNGAGVRTGSSKNYKSWKSSTKNSKKENALEQILAT